MLYCINMRTISIYELRENLGDYLMGISDINNSLIVTKHNKPIATIQPYNETGRKEKIQSFFGFLKNSMKQTGEEYVDKIRRNTKEKQRTLQLRNRK